MTKQELISRIENEQQQLETVIAGLSVERMLAARAIGEWSVKDVLAHLAIWTSRCVTVLYHAEQKRKPDEIDSMFDDWEALNQQDYELQKDRPPDRILSDLRGAHRQLLKRLSAWTNADELFAKDRYTWLRGTSLGEFLASEVADHDADHRAQIEQWLSC